MRKRYLGGLLLLCLFLLPPASGTASWFDAGKDLLNKMLPPTMPAASQLTSQDIIDGLKDALKVGSDNVIRQVGKENGFYNDPKIHIPLPPKFQNAQAVLRQLQLGGMLDELEMRLNRAAERAAPQTKQIFWQAIKEMSFDDAMRIYKGPQDAATLYFKEKTTPALKKAIRPIIDRTLEEAGAVQLYDQFIGKYAALPFVPDLKSDLTDHVCDKALTGIFSYLAEEEAAIRTDPAKRTTELLRRLFASQ
ncbi:MAG: DUF4197 domain-containing protein [Deltaproteobacteria bacterium]